MSDRPPRFAPPRRRCLATALAALLLVTAAADEAAAGADAPWPRLRGETAWPLFGKLSESARRHVAPAQTAATRLVTHCGDAGPGSLRQAITDAGEADVIDLSQLQCGRITLETGAIPVRLDNLTLLGRGTDETVIDGGDRDRLLIHYGFGTLTLRQLTVSGGYYRATGHDVAFGGCIAARSYLTLEHAAVRDCKAIGVGSYGGGTFSYALLMNRSTISGNLASGRLDDATTAGFGGGAYAYFSQVVGSTISGNHTDFQADPRFSSYGIGGGLMSIRGGSLYNSTIDSNYSRGRGGGVAAFGNLLVVNSTISGNEAREEVGGGLFLRWPSILQLDNSTVAFNHGGRDGGGVWLNAQGSYFRSSLVSGNALDVGAAPNAAADVGNAGNAYSPPTAVTIGGSHNLVGHRSPLTTLPPDTLDSDPQLDPLAPNGGPTRTHALRFGSPAIDGGGNPGGLAYDQRGSGFARAYGGAADIGAFERQAPQPAAVQTPVPVLSAWGLLLLVASLGLAASMNGIRRARRRA